MAYDPAPFVTKIKGKEYLEVKYRLIWLRDKYPNASIITEQTFADRAKKYYEYKATISYINDQGQVVVATGHAGKGDGGQGTPCESAETKAIGRACAAIGIGTQFVGIDLDEDLDGDDGLADSPVEAARAARSQEAPSASNGHSGQRTAQPAATPQAPAPGFKGTPEYDTSKGSLDKLVADIKRKPLMKGIDVANFAAEFGAPVAPGGGVPNAAWFDEITSTATAVMNQIKAEDSNEEITPYFSLMIRIENASDTVAIKHAIEDANFLHSPSSNGLSDEDYQAVADFASTRLTTNFDVPMGSLETDFALPALNAIQ